MRALLLLLLLPALRPHAADVPVWQLKPADELAPLERPCDPLVHRLWTPVFHDPHSFVFCHPIRRVLVEEACRSEGGRRKIFNPLTQKCVLLPPPSTPSVPPTTQPTTTAPLTTRSKNASRHRHPLYSRYGTIYGEPLGQKLRLSRPLAEIKEEPLENLPSGRLFGEKSLRCPIGRVPMRQPNSLEPVGCSSKGEIREQCGRNEEFRCTFENATSEVGVCCQRLPIGLNKCPPQMKPLVEADGMVRPCGRRPGLCREEGAVCVFDEQSGDFHCCIPEPPTEWEVEAEERPTTAMSVLFVGGAQQRPARLHKPKIGGWVGEEADGCPTGESAYYDPKSGAPLQCDGEITKSWESRHSVCPPSFRCRLSRSTKRAQCCGSNGGFCPANSGTLTAPNGKRVMCSRRGTGCPKGFFCDLRTHTCCSLEPLTAKCPHGLAAFLDGRARRCDRSASCPAGYECHRRFNESFCCPRAELVCSMELHEGLFCPSAIPSRQFYYDAEVGECRPYNFSGCSGNDNRFESAAQCETFCHLVSICPAGSPLRRADGHPITCTEERACGDGYSCHATFRGKFCCQTEVEDVCPPNSRPYVLNAKAVECTSDAGCPPSFQCTRDSRFLSGHCCTRLNGPITRVEPKKAAVDLHACSDGQPPIRTPDQEVQICVPDRLHDCPNDHDCQLNSFFGRYQCCPTPKEVSVKELGVCPTGTSLMLNPLTKRPLVCDREAGRHSGCPPFSKCEFSATAGRDVCCEPSNLKTLLEMSKSITPLVWRGVSPGQAGCLHDHSCTIVHPNTKCVDWVCRCTGGMVALHGACVLECPARFKEEDGVCVRVNPTDNSAQS